VRESKSLLRKRIRRLRRNLASENVKKLSAKVISNLLKLKEIETAKSFFIYVSVGNEVQTHDLIKWLLKKDKVVTVPKILREGVMKAYQITDWSQLKLGKYNIFSPTNKQSYDQKLEVCLAPGLALTKQGSRLGRGKGYYDRFLENNPEVLVIALAYDFQIVPIIPSEQNDKLVDIIVTEDKVIRK